MSTEFLYFFEKSRYFEGKEDPLPKNGRPIPLQIQRFRWMDRVRTFGRISVPCAFSFHRQAESLGYGFTKQTGKKRRKQNLKEGL